MLCYIHLTNNGKIKNSFLTLSIVFTSSGTAMKIKNYVLQNEPTKMKCLQAT